MNLFQLMAHCVAFLVGVVIAGPVARMFCPEIGRGFELVGGVTGLLLLSWPIFKRFGLRPYAPKCRTAGCGQKNYQVTSEGDGELKVICSGCQQVASLKRDRFIVLDSDGNPKHALQLRHPKLFAGWHNQPLNHGFDVKQREIIAGLLEKVVKKEMTPDEALSAWPDPDDPSDALAGNAWHTLYHYETDQDIRAVDIEYENRMLKELAGFVQCLRGNRSGF